MITNFYNGGGDWYVWDLSVLYRNSNSIYWRVFILIAASLKHNKLMEILEYLHPETILIQGGLWILILIVFLESGVPFGFFLPGDSLLFTAGLLCGTGIFPVSIQFLIVGLIVASTLGYIVGYFIGRMLGSVLKTSKRHIINPRHLESTAAFYKRNGNMAIVLGRFIPIVRTFAPILAGMIYAPFKKFMIYNLLGAVVWVVLLVYTGFWLGNTFPGVKEYLGIIIIGIIILSWLPALQNIFKKKFGKTV